MEDKICKAKNILEYTQQEKTSLVYSDAINTFFAGLDLFYEFQLAPQYLKYYTNKQYEIKSLNDFIDYLMLRKQSRYITEEKYIKDEVKEQFHKTYSELCSIFANYITKDAIVFVNKNYKLICEDQVVATITFDFIKDKLKGIDIEVLKEVADKYPYIWYKNFNEYAGYIKKNPIIAEIIFSEENLKTIVWGKYNVFFNCIIELRKHKEFSDISERCEKAVIRQMEILESQVSEDNVLEYRNIYKDFCSFLTEIKHNSYSAKNEVLKELDKGLQKHIAEKGIHHTYEIKGEDIEKHIGKCDPQYEVLMLTHQMDKSTSEIVHLFEIEMTKKGDYKTDLIDAFHYGHDINDYFSISKKSKVELTIFAVSSILSHYLLVEERRESLFGILRGDIDAICKKLNIDETEYDLINDLCVLELALVNAINVESNSKDVIASALFNHSIIMYGCSLIEKILRIVYIAENKEENFINLNNLTLGDLLNYEKNAIMINILGYHQTRCLRYLLHMDINEVGENLRNRIAHFKDITFKEFNSQNAIKVLWLLIGVINSLVICYCISKEEDTGDERDIR